jgi:lipid II isoglutaminyl synthase (glutamine-hydrolysing)
MTAERAKAPRTRKSRATRTIRAVHLYPVTMNTYGDRGNVISLTRRAEWRGIAVEWHQVELGEPAPEQADLVFMGGGQDRVQHAIAEDLRLRREWLARLAGEGAAIFAVCAGLQLLGRRYIAADGSELEGLGLLDLETLAARPGEWRLIGNVVAEVESADGPRILAGFENHGGRTRLAAVEPLGRVLLGYGNNGEDGGEGVCGGTVMATYLHGPVLPKNAWLTDRLLGLALAHAGAEGGLEELDDSFEDAAQLEAMLTAERDHADRRAQAGAAGRVRRAVARLKSLR